MAILGGFLVLLFIFNTIMRKFLGVKKKNAFSYNHVNDLHRNIDWAIRIAFIIGCFVSILVNSQADRIVIQLSYILTPFIICTEVVQAIFERKYAANPKDYIFTLCQLGFICLLLFSFLLYLKMTN